MAIATYYRGIEYRSRLEAKWASFFTRIGWRFTYEPLDGDGYIPDFLIHGRAPMLVEVKPATTQDDYEAPINKISTGLEGHWDRDILVVGVDPLPEIGDMNWGGLPAGLLGERTHGGWDFDAGLWSACSECGNLGVWHSSMLYTARPCAETRGDKSFGPSKDKIADAWAEATNDVKWRGAAA